MITFHKKSIFIFLFALFLGWGVTYLYFSKKVASNISLIRENSSEYQYINPLLIIDNSGVDFDDFDSMKSKIEKQIGNYKEGGLVDEVSLYFRDLNTSRWTGVNTSELYDPSSMLKVVTLLAYLKIAQDEPNILNKELFYKGDTDWGQFYKPEKKLTKGNHSIRDLLISMIVDSDNESMSVLNDYKNNEVMKVFDELKLPTGVSIGSGFMSVSEYSHLFRTLYSSTYLARSYSEEALKLLSQTKYKNGLVAGLTQDIVVSHKFGEHTFSSSSGEIVRRELHDCGIVYLPNKPYFICIMTKGKDFTELEKVISGLSSLVYKEIKNVK